jgi:hypothetical protein
MHYLLLYSAISQEEARTARTAVWWNTFRLPLIELTMLHFHHPRQRSNFRLATVL